MGRCFVTLWDNVLHTTSPLSSFSFWLGSATALMVDNESGGWTEGERMGGGGVRGKVQGKVWKGWVCLHIMRKCPTYHLSFEFFQLLARFSYSIDGRQ